ncbi:asparagine synthase (glutamine-hydrolyzing) [Comamonas terrae]|uniref:asparagine synthase (glutamine-hydrolyzing) n=1 Tax=Comamonas terrae TaxID=673548 RepID=A0ABW5UPC8_9BURK|nr:asparagine synthase (glutamine-hydrolyzing) [Comamonas terrae]
MCGFVGFLTAGQWARDEVAPGLLERMAETIVHRGPDSAGYWHDAAGGIALGHRRLAIVELSPAGAQPMRSACGRYVMAFNGEIYNHLDLRRQLGTKEHSHPSPLAGGEDGNAGWRGHSDTETLLAGFSVWGLRATLERCVGMFAIAVWDKKERSLTLARDRLGEKPLYYGWQGQGADASLLFGSDLAALKAHPAFAADINRDALSLYMRHNAIAAPHSIYRGICKLQPGCLLTASLAQREPKIEAYWSLPQVALQGAATPFAGTEVEAVDALEALLKDAVRQQMMADVPLGAFLSGGIDSSTVVALMQAQSQRPVKTFTIGFNEQGYNEALHAKAVAHHLGTDHTELYVTPQQALDVIPKLPQLYSEPFSDSSQIPTFLVSQLARQQVTVSLSGDAGDELFAGYSRYLFTRNLWRKLESLPQSLRRLGAAGIQVLSPTSWNTLCKPVQPLLPASLRQSNMGDKLHKGAALLNARSVDELYLDLVTHWKPDDLVLGAIEPFTPLRGNPLSLTGLDEVQRMMVLDAVTYLPDDILCKVDRAAMGVSLETRVPFLDHRVVEFAWKLPQHLKLRGSVGKWALRQVLYRHVPREMIERPKMGFGVPLDEWLRGPLRDWAEDLLSESRLRQEGYFNPVPIRQKWNEHVSGKRNWQHHLWDVLMFQAWLTEY